MVANVIIMEVGQEVSEFMKEIEAHDLPTIDVDQLLECVLGSLDSPNNPKEDYANLAFVAQDIAYGEGILSGPMEGDGYSISQRHAIFEAFMTLGEHLRWRVMDLGLVNDQGCYSHRFKEIKRDHILRLEQDEEQPARPPANHAPVAHHGYTEPRTSNAPHFADVGLYQQVSTRRSG